MTKALSPNERLIVAADFKPKESASLRWTEGRVLDLVADLAKTGVTIKLNSVLRAAGLGLIQEIHEEGLKVFADLKLFDIGETLSNDGHLLALVRPELLTVSCVSGVAAMKALKACLPDTEILGVTVLTSFKDADSEATFGCGTDQAVLRLAQFAEEAGVDGLISAPKEVEALRARFGDRLSLNTPAIRPAWALVKGDDQNQSRVMTPAQAIRAGADRIVVGRPITQDEEPYDAVMRTLDEIDQATK